jgi:hypothetical protein
LPYLTLDPLEIVLMDDIRQACRDIEDAVAGNADSLEALMRLACCEPGALPYPPDVLYRVPGTGRRSARVDNAVALDIGCGWYWHGPDETAPVETFELDAFFPELTSPYQVDKAIVALAQDQGIAVRTYFHLREVDKPEQIKLLIAADTEAGHRVLLSQADFRQALEQSVEPRIAEFCRKNGFGWGGIVFRSSPTLGLRLKGGGEWYDQAAEPPCSPATQGAPANGTLVRPGSQASATLLGEMATVARYSNPVAANRARLKLGAHGIASMVAAEPIVATDPQSGGFRLQVAADLVEEAELALSKADPDTQHEGDDYVGVVPSSRAGSRTKGREVASRLRMVLALPLLILAMFLFAIALTQRLQLSEIKMLLLQAVLIGAAGLFVLFFRR